MVISNLFNIGINFISTRFVVDTMIEITTIIMEITDNEFSKILLKTINILVRYHLVFIL